MDDDHKKIGAPWADVSRIREVFENEEQEEVRGKSAGNAGITLIFT